MSGNYGRSFASKLIQDGRYEAAIEAASRALALEEENPEHWADRAQAQVLLGREAEAVEDFIRALALDEEAQVLEVDMIDDALFSALLTAARAEAAVDVEAGLKRLARYGEVLPDGRHRQDAADWGRRLRGELKSEFVKVREG